jgi:hypothetical protein
MTHYVLENCSPEDRIALARCNRESAITALLAAVCSLRRGDKNAYGVFRRQASEYTSRWKEVDPNPNTGLDNGGSGSGWGLFAIEDALVQQGLILEGEWERLYVQAYGVSSFFFSDPPEPTCEDEDGRCRVGCLVVRDERRNYPRRNYYQSNHKGDQKK